jgi:predicted secreted Zn-dependent protease
VTMRNEPYPIGGDTAGELIAAMDAEGLRDPAGAPGWGLTEWHIDWTFRYRETRAACQITTQRVMLAVRLILPRWQPPVTASAALRARWRSFVEALRVHESGHVANVIAGANDILERLDGLAPRQGCRELEVAANAAANRILDRLRATDVAYDRETRHGATQGATFTR